MHRDEQIIYGLLCLASLGFYFVVIPWQIEEPDWVAVSPAFLPKLCTILVFVLALYKLLATFAVALPTYLVTRKNLISLIGILAIVTVATYAMFYLGFWVCAAVLLVPLQLISGQRNPVTIALYSAALIGGSWFLLDLAGLYILAPY